MKTGVLYLCIWLSMTAGAARSQQQPGDDRFGRYFFSPELLMRNEDTIGLSDDQRADLKSKIRHAHSNFSDMQWRLQDQIEKLISVIKQNSKIFETNLRNFSSCQMKIDLPARACSIEGLFICTHTALPKNHRRLASAQMFGVEKTDFACGEFDRRRDCIDSDLCWVVGRWRGLNATSLRIGIACTTCVGAAMSHLGNR